MESYIVGPCGVWTGPESTEKSESGNLGENYGLGTQEQEKGLAENND